MGKLIMLALLAGGGYYVYQSYFYKSEAFMAYEKFIAANRNGNCGILREMADGAAKTYVESFCGAPTMTVYGKTFKMDSAAGMAADLNSTPAAAMSTVVHKVESETASSGGNEVSLKVRESIRGRSTPLNPLRGPVRHTVKLQKAGSAWKIVEFQQEDIH